MHVLIPHLVNQYKGEPVNYQQVKFDGYYVEVYKSSSIKGSISTLYKKQNLNMWPKLRNQDVIRELLESLPTDTILRCELHSLSHHATSVPTLVNEASADLLLSPFKIEMWAGDSRPFQFFKEEQILRGHGFVVPKQERFFNMNTKLSPNAIESLEQEALDQKVEGFVLKDVPGGRLWKVKPEKTVDAVVVDYNISDSDSYAGGLKSVTVVVFDEDGKEVVIGTTGSGFKAEYKMTVDMKSLIGRVGEFGYQCMGSQGRMKFPKFLRWRDDEKVASECLINQIN